MDRHGTARAAGATRRAASRQDGHAREPQRRCPRCRRPVRCARQHQAPGFHPNEPSSRQHRGGQRGNSGCGLMSEYSKSDGVNRRQLTTRHSTMLFEQRRRLRRRATSPLDFRSRRYHILNTSSISDTRSDPGPFGCRSFKLPDMSLRFTSANPRSLAARRRIDAIAPCAWWLALRTIGGAGLRFDPTARRRYSSGTELESPLFSGSNEHWGSSHRGFAFRRYQLVDRLNGCGDEAARHAAPPRRSLAIEAALRYGYSFGGLVSQFAWSKTRVGRPRHKRGFDRGDRCGSC